MPEPGESWLSRERAVDLSIIAILAILGVTVSAGLGESIVVAGLIAVIAIGACAWRPAAGFASVMLALPVAYDLFPFAGARFSLLELAIVVTVGGFGLHLIRRGPRLMISRFREFVCLAEVTIPAALILVAAGVAFVFMQDSARATEALREIRQVIVEPIALLAVALLLLGRPSHRMLTVGALIVSGVLTAAIAIVALLAGSDGVGDGGLTRAVGPYPHPNNLAFFLERTTLLTCALIATAPRSILLWIALATQFLGLGMTFSRGAMIAIAIGVLILFAVRSEWRRFNIVGASLAGLLAIVAVVIRDRIFDAGGTGSEPTRFAIWRSSLRMIRDFPLFGVGPDQFLYQYGRRYVEPAAWGERYTSHPHNLVLDAWLRLGVLGMGAGVSLIAGVATVARRHWDVVRTDWIATGALMALGAGLVHGQIDNGFFLPDLAVFTWTLVALVATSARAAAAAPA